MCVCGRPEGEFSLISSSKVYYHEYKTTPTLKNILYITKAVMKKYEYAAKVHEKEIKCSSIPALASAINDEIGFPIVTNNSLYNHFIRPEVVKGKKLEALHLRREPFTSSS